MNRLGIVVPCYNEEQMLPITNNELNMLLNRLKKLFTISEDSFILYVDDGSIDQTWNIICNCRENSKNIYGLKLSRNVGHQNALTAGMIVAKEYSDIVVTIDADLQDDIEVIEHMIDQFNQGYDIVYGVRKRRDTDTIFKRMTALGFYRLMRVMNINIIYNHADFRLMSRRAVKQFEKYQETNLFLRGIIPLIGFKSTQVFYDRKARVAGKTKYTLKKMLSMAFDGITSFSIQPIRMITKLGLFIVFVSLFAGVYALYSYFYGRTVAGWTSLILSIWFIGGIQLTSIGLIGTYIGKIYMEVKHRPRYNIEINNLDELLVSNKDA